MRRLKKKHPQGILRNLLGQSGLQNQADRRTLRIESLESRQMLSAAPWMHNSSDSDHRAEDVEIRVGGEQGGGNDITFNCHATPAASGSPQHTKSDNLRGSVTVNFANVKDAYSTIFSFEFQELTLLQYNSGTTADVDHPDTKPTEAAIQSDRSSNDTVNWNINGWHIENFSVDQVMSQLGGQEGEDLVDTIGSPTDGLIAIIALNGETPETDHVSPQQIDGEATDKDHKGFTMSIGDIKGEATDKEHIASAGMKDAARNEFTQCHLNSSEYVPSPPVPGAAVSGAPVSGAPVSGEQLKLKSTADVGFNPQPQPPGNDWTIVGNPSLETTVDMSGHEEVANSQENDWTIIGNPSLQKQPGSDGFWVAPSLEAAAVVELSEQIDADSADNINQLGDIKGESTDKEHASPQDIDGKAQSIKGNATDEDHKDWLWRPHSS